MKLKYIEGSDLSRNYVAIELKKRARMLFVIFGKKNFIHNWIKEVLQEKHTTIHLLLKESKTICRRVLIDPPKR